MIGLAITCVLGLAVVAFVALGRLIEYRPRLGSIMMVSFSVAFLMLVVTFASNVDLD